MSFGGVNPFNNEVGEEIQKTSKGKKVKYEDLFEPLAIEILPKYLNIAEYCNTWNKIVAKLETTIHMWITFPLSFSGTYPSRSR